MIQLFLNRFSRIDPSFWPEKERRKNRPDAT
jgi:hypothetical protein